MDTYILDLDAGQVVRWLQEEQKAGTLRLRVAARRSRELDELPVQGDLHLGDIEREDLSEVTTLATLDIEPVHASEGWRLSVVVEDEIGPRISDRKGGDDGDLQLDLATFDAEFIRSGRGSANVVAEVEDQEAEERLQLLLDAIEENRHDTDRKPAK